MNDTLAQVERRTLAVSAEQPSYAGFWVRAGAFIVDSFIISIPLTILSIPLVGYNMFQIMPYMEQYNQTQTVSPEMASALFLFWGTMLLVQLISIVFFWLYFALFESSSKQATWGKQLFGLHVTDSQGQRISFARATGRTFAKIISYAILYIGFMMAGWTKEKCALHDFIAGTRVVKNH